MTSKEIAAISWKEPAEESKAEWLREIALQLALQVESQAKANAMSGRMLEIWERREKRDGLLTAQPGKGDADSERGVRFDADRAGAWMSHAGELQIRLNDQEKHIARLNGELEAANQHVKILQEAGKRDADSEPCEIRCSDCGKGEGDQHRPSCHRQGAVTIDSDYRDPASNDACRRLWERLTGLAESSTAPATGTQPSDFIGKLKELQGYIQKLDMCAMERHPATLIGLAQATVEHLLKLADPEAGKRDAQPGAGSSDA